MEPGRARPSSGRAGLAVSDSTSSKAQVRGRVPTPYGGSGRGPQPDHQERRHPRRLAEFLSPLAGTRRISISTHVRCFRPIASCTWMPTDPAEDHRDKLVLCLGGFISRIRHKGLTSGNPNRSPKASARTATRTAASSLCGIQVLKRDHGSRSRSPRPQPAPYFHRDTFAELKQDY
jgi:hypothetical protein